MVRTQIQLDEDLYRRLRRWARKLDISLAEAVRRCVAGRLAREQDTPSWEERVRSPLTICGKYRDPAGRSRIAREHDRHLATAFRK